MPEMGYIYELVDPRTGETKYVGATVTPDSRLDSHINNPHSDALDEWVSSLLAENSEPEMNILHEHPVEELASKESEVIREYKSPHELLNARQTSGYRQGDNVPTGSRGGRTTIEVSADTKAVLESEKGDYDTFNDVVRRLAGESSGRMWTETEIRELTREECQ